MPFRLVCYLFLARLRRGVRILTPADQLALGFHRVLDLVRDAAQPVYRRVVHFAQSLGHVGDTWEVPDFGSKVAEKYLTTLQRRVSRCIAKRNSSSGCKGYVEIDDR